MWLFVSLNNRRPTGERVAEAAASATGGKGKGKGKTQNKAQPASPSSSISSGSLPTSPKKGKGGKNNAGVFTNGLGNGGGLCKDCACALFPHAFIDAHSYLGGTMHKEIFEFKRPKKGRYKGKEWELLVKPIIEKWGDYVENYL